MNTSNAQPRQKVAPPEYDLRECLQRAVKHFGSQGKLAAAVKYAQPSIHLALLRGQASKALANRIHKATRGKFPKWDVRPDLFSSDGPEL